MDIITGFEISDGTIVSDKTGEVIPYSNRILYCVSDDAPEGFHGFIPFKQKVKTSELATWFNISDALNNGKLNVNVVDSFLDSILQREIKIKRGPNRNGDHVVTGISLAKKPSEA